MKLVLFACLLIVAGVSALPQEVDVADATPNQGRFVDTWIENRVRLLVAFIQLRGYDPFYKHLMEFDEILLEGIIYLKGRFQQVEVRGLSGIFINYVYYDIFLGRLQLDIVLAQLSIAIGNFESEVRIGDIGGSVEYSGSVVISGLRLVGNSLMSVFPGGAPTILNIDARLTVDNIEAKVEVQVKTLDDQKATDVTETVNNFLNKRLLELVDIHQELISTVVGEVIRQGVNWGWRP